MCRSRRFSNGGGLALSADSRGKWVSPTNHCWYQSSRVIALSCGIKISAVRHLHLSQCTRVTDGQTDGRTDRITTPKTAVAYARAVKTKKNQFQHKNPWNTSCSTNHTQGLSDRRLSLLLQTRNAANLCRKLNKMMHHNS